MNADVSVALVLVMLLACDVRGHGPTWEKRNKMSHCCGVLLLCTCLGGLKEFAADEHKWGQDV